MPVEEEKIENIIAIILNSDLESFERIMALDLFADHSQRFSYLNKLEVLLVESQADIKQKFAHILRKIDSDLSRKFLRILLDDTEPAVRQQAIQSLGFIGTEGYIPDIIAKLQDESSIVRYEAAITLSTLGWEPTTKKERIWFLFAREKWNELLAIEDLPTKNFYAYLQDKDDNIRARTADLLGKAKDEGSLDLLYILVLNDLNNEVRDTACKAIAEIGSKKSIQLLVQASNSDDWYVRKAVAESLGFVVSKTSIETLLALARDDNYFVQRAAKESLEHIAELAKKRKE